MAVSLFMVLLLSALASAGGLQHSVPAGLQFQAATSTVLELGEEDLHNHSNIADALLSSEPVVAAADAGINEIMASEALRTKAHSTILQVITNSKSLDKPQQLVEEVHQALDKEGILALAKDVGKNMAKAEKAKRDRGDSWAKVDSFFLGFGLHFHAKLPLTPGGDAIFYIPICTAEECTFDYHEEEHALEHNHSAKKAANGEAKTCGGVMGGISPVFNHAKEYFAPAGWSANPYFLIGGGTFKYSAGPYLEAGGAYENDYIDIVGAMKFKPTFKKMKAFLFEFTSPKVNIVTPIKKLIQKEHYHHHKHGNSGRFIAYGGGAWCTDKAIGE